MKKVIRTKRAVRPGDRIMRVLITTFTFPPQVNGVSEVVAAHAFGLLQRGHEIIVATGYDANRSATQFPENLQVVQFKVSGNGNLRVGYQGDIEAYQRFIAGFDGDVIICHCWQIWSTDLALHAFTGTQAKKVLVSHGASANSLYGFPRAVLSWLGWRPYVWRLPAMLRAFDHIVFLTAMVNRETFYDCRLVHKLGLPNWSVIPNGTYPERFAAELPDFRSLYDIGDAPLILQISNYESRKNQEMALRAFLRLKRKDAVLVFIGNQLNDYACRLSMLYQEANRSPLIGRVLFLANLEKEVVYAAYRAADLYVCSSKWEAQPLVVLDAMASGTPVISTSVGCVSELPGHVTVRSETEMAHQISELLTNAARRLQLGEAGRAACISTYNWTCVIDAYEALLQDINN